MTKFFIFKFIFLNIFELNDLRKKYESINYSSTEINSAIHKLISFPFYLTIMTILAASLMLSIKHNKSKVFHLIFWYSNFCHNLLFKFLF